MGCANSTEESQNSFGPKTLFVSRRKGHFKTLSDAVSHANAGDRIIVDRGTFAEANVIIIDKPLEILAASCVPGIFNNNLDSRLEDEGAEGLDTSSSASTEQYGNRSRSSSSSNQQLGVALGTVGSSGETKIISQRGRLITVDVVPGSLTPSGGAAGGMSSGNSTGSAGGGGGASCGAGTPVILRGLKLSGSSDDQAVVCVVRGTLMMDRCDVGGGQDCVAVHGAAAVGDLIGCTLHNASHAALSYGAGARGVVRSTIVSGSPTGVIISAGGDPAMNDCSIRECGTGILVRDGGCGVLTQCVIEHNTKPGIIVSGRSNPVLRRCRISDGGSNGVFVRDDGRGTFLECEISSNALPAVATFNESNPVLCECTIRDGHNAGILVYDNGAGIISKCSIHDNHMPGIEVRAGGHPLVCGCDVFNHESNGIYVHNRGRGVFHNCRVYENVLPGIAIRTAGHPVIHSCSVVTGKDSALMVCDKGRGIILDSALKGYSTKPLEIRDGCNPLIHGCELHDGKHKHVAEWLKQVPKSADAEVIRANGWTESQLAEEDALVLRTSADLLKNGPSKIPASAAKLEKMRAAMGLEPEPTEEDKGKRDQKDMPEAPVLVQKKGGRDSDPADLGEAPQLVQTEDRKKRQGRENGNNSDGKGKEDNGGEYYDEDERPNGDGKEKSSDTESSSSK